jgi:hypothetical protein
MGGSDQWEISQLELVRRMNVGEEAKSICDDLSFDYKSRWF